MRTRSLLLYFLIAAFVTIADQVSKSLIQIFLYEGDKISVIGDLLYFRLIYNAGGAMGTSIGPSWVYLILTVVALVIIIRYLIMTPEAGWHIKTALAMILGGAVGNLIDRVIYGKVIDFIDMDFPDIPFLYIRRWFTYNVADAAITIGLFVFVIGVLFKKKDKYAPIEDQQSSEILEEDGDGSYT
ncbi:MAG: signal peptidase II [Candidatus Zixiibacteriota bacterium]|nr:MAG: signal peptidase II [candidate division Zixibacteria bacterium]